MSFYDYINLKNGGFVICDRIYIDGVYHIIINYTYKEVTLKNKDNDMIAIIDDIKSRKNCKFIEKIKEDVCSVDNYIERCFIKNGEFIKWD